MKTLSALLLLWLLQATLLFSAEGKPYGDDNNDIYSNDDYEDDEPKRTENVILENPRFVSQPKNELVNEQATIRLPCILNRLEGFVLLWKKGEDILTVGKQVIDQSGRMSLEEVPNGNHLLIALAEEEDAGNYTCQISTYQPSEQHHSVKIRVRPEVKAIPENGLIVAKTGESVTLRCEVTRGRPHPELRWRRRDRKLPSGEEFIRGDSLTYRPVTRHHSGNYICEADNGFGEPSTTLLKLDVQHSPEIEQEETFIHTGEGDRTEVICIVHSSPRAEVTWYKDGRVLDTSEYTISDRGNRHTLLIPEIQEASFGDYTCEATNQFGKASKTTRVSGKAGEVTYNSNPKGSNYDRYLLEWTGKSSTPITHFRIQYRAEKDLTWQEQELNAVNLQGETYTGGFTLPQLRPATVYLARVASKNAYGYNDYGTVFKFATKGADPVQKPITGGGASATSQTSFPLLLTLLVLATRWLL